MPALRTRLPFRCASAGLCCSGARSPGVCPPPDAWATYVASYSFTANWSSVSGATGYRLDVSTSSSFSTYVPGYQNLNVGNATSRSVTGLNPSTTYYYRVRAYWIVTDQRQLQHRKCDDA